MTHAKIVTAVKPFEATYRTGTEILRPSCHRLCGHKQNTLDSESFVIWPDHPLLVWLVV